MRTLRRYMRIHRLFVAQHMKRMMEYRADYIIGMVGAFTLQALGVLFIWVVFSGIPALKGWTFYQVLFIYGFAQIPKSLDHLFFDRLWMIAHFVVRRGDFDIYLTRPIDTLIHVLLEWFQPDAIGEVLTGAALIIVSAPRAGIHLTPMKIVLGVLVVPFAAMIYTAVKTATAATAFWTKGSANVISSFYSISDFTKYPADIYNKAVRGIITFVVPFAFTSFYPAQYILLDGVNPLFNIGGTVVVSVVLMSIAVFVWRMGVKNAI